MFVSCEGFTSSFEGCRLILPSISVGNVGQLAVDVLINSLRLEKVGYLHHPGLLPLVGNDAFDHAPQTGHLHTTAEVYYGAEKQIAVVQIRTPLAKGFQQSFSTNLVKWMRDSGFIEVVLLTSSYAHERRDIQIQGRQHRFLLNSQSSNLYTHFTNTLNWTCLEPRGEPDIQSSPKDGVKDTVLSESQFFLPGSGLTKKLYFDSMVESVKLVVLIAFCSQGDNVLDATSLVSYLDEWLKLKLQSGKVSNTESCTASWECPDSWSLMYGGPSPENLF